ncbi:MAG: serine/threonine-protein kinase [Thermoanaerobaculia bacterium]
METSDWKVAERLLDELWDLPAAEREPRLEGLARDHPALADALRRALDDTTAGDRVEEHLPALLTDGGEATAPIPERIGIYRVRALLGEGGMGTVYRAERDDGSFEQTVALKLLHRRELSSATRARFLQERQLLARLAHPRIARLLDGGLTPEGEPYFAMEFVDGEPIDRHCDAVRATLDERLRLFDQVLEAVHFAHQNLVLHRDLKPGNILVTPAGDVKLLDFGIAKLLDDAPGAGLTQAGDRWMTPDFASPEQVAGEPVSTGSDVYSLGVLLHRLLTGLHPLDGLRGEERRGALLEGRIPRASTQVARLQPRAARDAARERRTSPRALVTALRGDLDAILARATRREPEERYGSVEPLRADLRRYRTGYPVEASRGSWSYTARKFWRRHRVAVTAAGLVAASLAVGLGVAVRQARVARRAEARAAAINRFLTDELIGSANPEVAQGRELTVADVLSAAERNLSTLREQPEIVGSVRRTLAHVRLRLGDHEAAKAQLAAAEHDLSVRGEAGAELAAVRRIGAELALAEGDLDTAGRRAAEAVDLAERTLGPDALETLEAKMLLGQVQSARWESIAAEATLRDVVVRLERAHPEARRLRWAAKRRLAEALTRQTRRTESIELLREVLALQEETLGPAHPDVGRTSWELAGPLGRLRYYDEAESAARRALSILETAFGAAHPETQRARYELGKVFVQARREDEAIPILEEVIALGERSPGAPDLAVVDATNALGVIHSRRDEPEESVRLYRRALADAERLLGPGHETPSMVRRNPRNRLEETGRHAEAVELATIRRIALDTAEDPFADPMVLANNAWFLPGAPSYRRPRSSTVAPLLLAERAVWSGPASVVLPPDQPPGRIGSGGSPRGDRRLPTGAGPARRPPPLGGRGPPGGDAPRGGRSGRSRALPPRAPETPPGGARRRRRSRRPHRGPLAGVPARRSGPTRLRRSWRRRSSC